MVDSTHTLPEAANAASAVIAPLCTEIFPWVQTALTPGIILVTAYIAWAVQRTVLAKRATFDYIANHELDDEWQDLIVEVKTRLKSRPNKDRWGEIATHWSQDSLSDEDLENIKPILFFLNRREFISICLLNGSMHRPTYADWWGISLTQEWERAKPFIDALRSTDKGDAGLFCKFEELANSDKYKKLSGWTENDSIHHNRSS